VADWVERRLRHQSTACQGLGAQRGASASEERKRVEWPLNVGGWRGCVGGCKYRDLDLEVDTARSPRQLLQLLLLAKLSSAMFNPVRAGRCRSCTANQTLVHFLSLGTRGGAGEFKWSDVKADKDRENYLGHSINAPQGRWQNQKDIHWYNRNKSDVTDEEAIKRQKARELREIKMREENELSIALGYGPVHDPDKIGLEEEEDEQPGGEAKTERELELAKLEAEEKLRRKE
jgi:hypothetical protein